MAALPWFFFFIGIISIVLLIALLRLPKIESSKDSPK